MKLYQILVRYCPIVFSRVYFNVNRQILQHHKCTGKRMLDISIIGLKLVDYIYFYKVIKFLIFLGNFWLKKTMIKIYY